jgi:excisionase family DNA binding protein
VEKVKELLCTIMEEAKEVAHEKIPAVLAQLAGIQGALAARMLDNTIEKKQASYEPNEDQLLTAQEAAHLLSLKPDYVLSLARNHSLPSIQLGRYVRFRRSDLGELIKQKRKMNVAAHISYNTENGRKRASTDPKTKSVYADRIRGPRRRRVEQNSEPRTQTCMHPRAALAVDSALDGTKGK